MFVTAYAPYGAEGIIIRVEADIRRGIPGIDITGLAEGAVREARERVRASFRNSGYAFPADRILINLAPAGVRKEGASLDLPIAVAVMAAAGLVPQPENLMVMGELELSGRLRPVRGVLAAAAAGLKAEIRDFIVPAENAREAAILAGDNFFAAATLCEAVHALQVRAETGKLPPYSYDPDEADPCAGVSFGLNRSRDCNPAEYCGDFSEVKGQARYKRALEIAAAGGHNLLAFGPPGSGKTMLARRIPGIMPLLDSDEAVEVTRLHSLAGQLKTDPGGGGGLITQPPFRSPHHSASTEGILGGGRVVRPGEITLAHWGVLFLDEAPEFRSNVLQSLREPLEDRVITIARAEGPVRLPADFQLLMAANTCPCGRLGMASSDAQACFCTAEEIHRYWRRIGAALLDRVELRAPAPAPGLDAFSMGQEEPSVEIALRVERAAAIQKERFKGLGIRRNARMSPSLIDQYCPLTPRAREAFHTAAAKLGLSGRAYHGILRVARTIADLEGKEMLDTVHILEAVEHRRLGEDPYDIFTVGK
ncbi:YifB family Mg chelatase-like AAA ATPase [Leadbettera azotonutricia]|uniref:Mg chelatase-like protein n=1 Tax=Leadbettera azotonutricia (strain ATCC BAA-888 / DSM 13862 / ZAS-9) TaxID=545695 RepID=F5YE08_LEAAZ|nr:YifB family Mg chelatase-like AAA ATPase [Leadbettera azotonutricia]AEF82528.1 Mg chelatase-like protein [Leadbettera azotonutricia ZAS-9]